MGGILALIVILILAIVVFFRYYYVFGEGVKSGQLNYLVKKGNIFKTYEGKLIQSGLRGGGTGSVQSYEFEFSVTNERVADELMKNSGKDFDLHYKEYHGTLPWRGFTKYVVDSIYTMR
ncbi:hypothetical protein GS399_11360 [Pedobacter sp. HMF7647]|uniref:DUF3592 domain-containing protein n=1 Tax=Hufsiella arboris TaxID=2695275 RepID=A0A7K1YBV9_9SPHI|nr:hypothetical protein [Hufsiella arboris]